MDLMQLARDLPGEYNAIIILACALCIIINAKVTVSARLSLTEWGVLPVYPACREPGLVGADLANIVNEAAMTAARQGRDVLTAKDIFAGVDRFTQASTYCGIFRQWLSQQCNARYKSFAFATAYITYVHRERFAHHCQHHTSCQSYAMLPRRCGY